MAEVYAERGQEIPEHIRPKVDLPALERLESSLLEQYIAVRSERPVGGFGGLAPIPWSAMHQFALWHGYTGAAHDWFIRVIRRIDGAMIKDAEERSEKKHSGSRRPNNAK